MELFRRNSKVCSFVMVKGTVIHAYLVHNVTATRKQFTGTASMIEEISGKCTSAIDSTHCINMSTAVLCCLKSNYVTILVKKFSRLDRQIKISVDTILHRPSVKIQVYFPMNFQVISIMFLFISY
jgi:hypothetical protein